MDLDVVFAGTSGSVPTPKRGLASCLIRRGGERILIDCGEGTQRQLMRSVGLTEIDLILVTHIHADHVLGIPGMLKTFSLHERSHPLVILGPRGFMHVFRDLRALTGKLSYTVEVDELPAGHVLERDGYVLEAVGTEHSVPSLGWKLAEHDRPGRFDIDEAQRLGVPEGPAWGKLQRGDSVELENGTVVTPDMVLGEPRTGRTIVYSGDTAACASVREAAADAELLIHEATFSIEEQERAHATKHSTAQEAALTAAAANVQMLALTHLSNRYFGKELLEEAQTVFERTVSPKDFDQIVVPFRERGVPELIKGGGKHGTKPDSVPAETSTAEVAAAL
jgi:ribonuclease Z